MESTDLILAAYLTFFGGGVAALFWTRMNRLEDRLVSVETRMATKDDFDRVNARLDGTATKEDFHLVGQRLVQTATKDDLDRVNRRLDQTATKEDVDRIVHRLDQMSGEMAIMRSDLTHVALAVGARPKAPGT